MNIGDKIEQRLAVFWEDIIFLFDDIRLFCKDHPEVFYAIIGLLSIIVFCLILTINGG